MTQQSFFDLDAAVKNLVEQVRTYQSDTFDAPGEGVSEYSAKQMAAWLINTLLFDPSGLPGDAIDGAVIGLAWDKVELTPLNLKPSQANIQE